MLKKTVAFVLLIGGSPAFAQSQYDQFVGQYVAATIISNECSSLTARDAQSAADIGKAQNRLRKQKVLRLLYYSKTVQLTAVGRNALTERQVDPDNSAALCAFGKQVASKQDEIGRFLSSN